MMPESNDTGQPPQERANSLLVGEELSGMKMIVEALVGKDKETCARMLDWAADIFTDSVLMPRCKRGRDFPYQP